MRPPGRLTRWCCPTATLSAATSSSFIIPQPPLLVKRVVGLPGDRLRIEDGRVYVNGVPLDEPYAAFEPAPPNPFRDNFPAQVYTDPQVDPDWWLPDAEPDHGTASWWFPPGRVFCARRQPQSQQGFALLGFRAAAGHCGPSAGHLLLARRPSTTDVQQAALRPEMIDSDTTGSFLRAHGLCALEAHLPRGALECSDQLYSYQ